MQNLVLICSPFIVYSLTSVSLIRLTLVAMTKKYWAILLVFLKFFFSFHPTVVLFSIYEMKCFPCNQPYLPLFYFSPRIEVFFVIVVVFGRNSPRNCRCNALSASLEVIMRSVCFCEDNRESQGILSYFPDGRVGVGLESTFVCIETDRGRQIWRHKVMSPLNIIQQAYFS